ncbi:unnamed protein product [Scytosiphon promiscuus]
MQEHTDEITALAVSPCGKWVATGEVGAHPKVIVWNGTTKKIKTMVAGFHTVGIAGLAWSPCGNLLASVGADSWHSLQITEAVSSSSARPTFRVRTGLSRPLGMSWTGDGSSLVTCGQTHKDSPPLVFWVREASTGSFARKRGIARGGNLAPSSDVQLVVAAVKAVASAGAGAAPSPPCIVSGTAGGGLCLWRGRNCSLAVKDAHLGAVEVLSVGTLAHGGGAVVASGGRDAKVKLWSVIDLSPLATLDVMATPSVAGLRQVRSVCLSSDGTKVLVGTLGSDILELATVEKPKGEDGEDEGEEAIDEAEEGEEGAEPKAKRSGIGRVLNGGQPLVCGHCKGEAKGVNGELNSVDVSPQGDQFVTGGDDGTVRVWSNGDKKVAKAFNIGSSALSVSYSPDASLIAVGLAGGGVSVMKPSEEDVTTLQLEKHLDAFPGAKKAGGGGATCVRFSPNGATLSAGSWDGSVKAWSTAESDWEAVGSADKVISGSIIGMDFTTDGRFLMINSSGMDMIVVNAETCKKASPKDMKALRGEGEGGEVATWATSTCTMTDGKQAAWATMLSAAENDSGDSSGNSSVNGNASETSPSPPQSPPMGAASSSSTPSVTATITGSDLVKGGETPVLLACDSLGRVGLLRYPAQLPPPELAHAAAVLAAVVAAADPQTAEGAAVADGADGTAAAVPRLSMMKAHAGKVAAVRQIGEGGAVITLGAEDRCVYQWAVAVEDGEESGEELPDPPASWSGDDEDLVENVSAKSGSRFNGSQDISALLAKRDRVEFSETKPPLPAWLDGNDVNHQSEDSCIPDEDLELEWIHGYSAQGSRQNLVYNRNGEIVYPAACAGVVMTKRTKPLQHRQTFNLDHTQAITCLAMHPDKAHVATGQEGSSPVVLVWDSTSKPPETEARLQLGADKKGVSQQVSFSPDGCLLAVACEDRSHTVMVFRWKSGVMRCQARLGVKKALSLCFSLNADELLAGGHKHFKVWTLSGGGLMQGKRGLFGSGSKVQALTCAEAMSNGEGGGSSFILGGSSGNLLKIEGGRKVSSEIEAHEGPVYALYVYPAPDGSGTCLVTGGGDGKIKTWDSELGVVNEFDLVGRPYLLGGAPCVRSVCLNDHSDGRKILIGTACSEIIEISASDGTDVNGGDCLMRGHFRDQLCGLASHPAKPVYASSGDEGMLKEWDVVALALKREIDLGGWIRALRYSPNGLLIACGMGGEPDDPHGKRHSPREEDGTIKIVSGMEDAFRVVNTLSDAVGPITCIRFSPDGNRMAGGSLDGNIYIYSVLENFKLECIGEGGQGGIMRMDFSSDGDWIRAEAPSTTLATLLFSASSGEVSEDKAAVDPVSGFATWSGLCSGHVSGVWPADATSPLDVTSCCRSLEGGLLATSDARGDVKLFRYPAAGAGASFKAFKVHAPGVRSVCFLDKGIRSQNLLSVGGRDRCVAQWKVIHPDTSGGTTMLEASKAGNVEQDAWVQAELSALACHAKTTADPSVPRPWVSGPGLSGAPPTSDASAPTGMTSMSLEFAHGYNSSGLARNNLGFSNSDRVVLPCASVGVVYDKASHSQVLFACHHGRIASLAVSPCRRFVATGQEGKNASAMVWDPATGHKICALPTSLFGAVRRLSFSPDGSMLCGIGADRDNSLCVWSSASGDWADGARVALGQGPRRAPMFVAWAAVPAGAGRCGGDRGSSPLPYQVMTGGQNFVVFWTLHPNLSSRLGRASTSTNAPRESAGTDAAEKSAPAVDSERAPASNEAVSIPTMDDSSVFSTAEKAMAETFTCGVVISARAGDLRHPSHSSNGEGDVTAAIVVQAVTGTASGAFVVWENHECVRMIQGAHGALAVLCLSPTHSGGFVSGGADGHVRVWNANLNAKGAPISISEGGSACEAVRAVAVNRKESNMAVGTSSGRVVEVSLDSGDTSVLVDAHAPAPPAPTTAAGSKSDGAAPAAIANRTAVTAIPNNPDLFLTTAHDGYLRKWSTGGCRLTAKLACAAKGLFAVCGLVTGDVVLVSPEGDMEVLSRCPSDKKPKSPISAVAVSADEAVAVVGCEDGSLHGMKLSQGGAGVQHSWSKPAAASKAAAVLAIDLSTDGKKSIRYCDASGAFSYATSDGTDMPVAPSGDEASTWASAKCFVGNWGVHAASDPSTGAEASASGRSNSKDILAACSDDSPIGLWRYPASQERAACLKGTDARVAAPAALSFTADDSKIIVVGGKDNSILQWNVARS